MFCLFIRNLAQALSLLIHTLYEHFIKIFCYSLLFSNIHRINAWTSIRIVNPFDLHLFICWNSTVNLHLNKIIREFYADKITFCQCSNFHLVLIIETMKFNLLLAVVFTFLTFNDFLLLYSRISMIPSTIPHFFQWFLVSIQKKKKKKFLTKTENYIFGALINISSDASRRLYKNHWKQ